MAKAPVVPVVDHRRADFQRRHLGGPGHRHQARHRLDDVVVTRLSSARPSFPKADIEQ